MNYFSTDTEIYEFAISREIEANALYSVLSERVKDPELKEVFARYAEEELEHKAKLELEIMKTGRTVVQDMPVPADMGEIELQDDLNLRDALVFAIDKEKQAFRLYVDLAQVVHDQLSREILLNIAEEEARHMARFQAEYDKLT
jgi:rubrerythrin